MITRTCFVLTVALLMACSGTGKRAAEQAQRQKSETSSGSGLSDEERKNNQALRDALDRASMGNWQEMDLLAHCSGTRGVASVRLYGNGVGIWGRKRQFSLGKEHLIGVFQVLEEVDFSEMPKSYGGRSDPQPPGENFATAVTCRVRLELDGLRKEVVQFQKGWQSIEFKQAVWKILDICGEPGSRGVSSQDLDDALAKIASGELASEALSLMLSVRSEGQEIREGQLGWTLRVDGRKATSLPLTKAGYGELVVLTLDYVDIESLAERLSGLNLKDLPVNLYAERYHDFSLEVLNWKKVVQARQFTGMTADRHGEKQLLFDQALEILERLNQQVLSEGSPTTE